MLRSLEGRSEGDPRKIADVIVQLANSDEVPLRLILGVDAEKRVHQAEAARASEAEKWRHLTVSTVFEDEESIPELLNHQPTAQSQRSDRQDPKPGSRSRITEKSLGSFADSQPITVSNESSVVSLFQSK